MEVSGVIFRSMPCLNQSYISKSCFFTGDAGISISDEMGKMGHQDLRVYAKPRKAFGFCDDGHVEYYKSLKMIRCGGVKEKEKELESKEKKMKKKLKMLKGLSKNISVFSGMGFGLDSDVGISGEVKGKMISEAADMLLAQLEQLKAEKKEIKKQRKEEKSKLKALRVKNKMACKGNSSSSSESSDDECGQVIDMNRLKIESRSVNDLQKISQESTLIIPSTTDMVEERSLGVCNSQITSSSDGVSNVDNLYSFQGNSLATESLSRKIEVCMGGKCKKLGAATLMDEFQKAVGVEGSVVGCKCMGKCKSAPNVKVLNSIDGIPGEVIDDSVRTPANPLCIGVGLEDVGTIVSNFFGAANQNDLGLAAAS